MKHLYNTLLSAIRPPAMAAQSALVSSTQFKCPVIIIDVTSGINGPMQPLS